MKKLSFVLSVGMIALWIAISILGIIVMVGTTQDSSESSSSSQSSLAMKKFEFEDEAFIRYLAKKSYLERSSSEEEKEAPSTEKVTKKTTKKKTTVVKEEPLPEVITQEIIPEESTEEFVSESGQIKIGRCRLTIYTPNETHWGYTTATGVRSEHLATCAVDPRIIPYGSTVILKANGNEWRLKAVDCGNFRGKMIDVFYDGSVSAGVSWLVSMFGSEYAEVWIER